MSRPFVILFAWLVVWGNLSGQSPSFQTYLNPVIPGDHPDPTLTKIGNDFYTSGSSFNPTPKIYHSTDLVHWEVIAQPVSASWSTYGNSPGGGIWGGHMVLYNGIYWHYFGKGGGSMYFVTADQPEGQWSAPTRVQVPADMSGLGVDNSIFIDDDNKWYLLTKAGEPNNHIVELGNDGQPTGVVLDLTWLNPGPAPYPYGWAEGPVMWKHNGYYYYSFAQHLVGSQYVMRSETLTDDESAWTIVGENIFSGARGTYNTPNHISPVVTLDDGTSWTIAHSYNSSWYAHGRQGLLCQVTYDAEDFPVIQFPSNSPVQAPALPSNGIPWTVPRSDMFNTSELEADWSFLGYKPTGYYSLTEREGWLYLRPYNGSNTIIQNDGEHCYSIITRVDFSPESGSDEAGLWIMNGPETHHAKVYSTADNDGNNMLTFSFQSTAFETENTIGSIVWLKLLRNEHIISGYYSADGIVWTQIGESINAQDLDVEQTQFNNFTGNQQGLYVNGKAAYFDLYIYRDAYTPILAECPANQYGTSRAYVNQRYVLDNIHANDWAMYAGVEFGNADYDKIPNLFNIIASSTTAGNCIEVWLDSLDTGAKIAECSINNTGDLSTFQRFTSDVTPITGQHDIYLKFTGVGTDKLFRLQSFYFTAEGDTSTAVGKPSDTAIPQDFGLEQNFPNPFNPETTIRFHLPIKSSVRLVLINILGDVVREIVKGEYEAGHHEVTVNAENLATGTYFYRIETGEFNGVKKCLIVK